MKNWDDFKYYLAIARSGSVSAAAQELEVSHATVLRRIDQLEISMGAKLFRRLQSGYQLSETGEALYETASNVEAEVQKMYSQVQGNQLAGKIRVSQPTAGAFDLYSIYAEFIKQYPSIELEILPIYWDVNINRQEADVAIITAEEPHELLVGRALGHVTWQAYASKRYLAEFSSEPSPAELNWVMLERSLINRASGGSRNIWDVLQSEVKHPKVVLQTQSYPELLFAVQEGVGATFMSDAFAHKLEDIVPVPGCQLHNKAKYWILTNRDLRHIERIKCFMTFVGDRLRQQLSQDG